MSRTLKFANMLAGRLHASSVTTKGGVGSFVKGSLDTGPTTAEIEVFVPWLFRNLKRHPPVVLCNEPWMRTGADWHNGPPTCWILPEEWREAMNWKGKPVKSILDEGVVWLISNVSCLLNRHYCAHLEGLTEWPEEWPAWGHDWEGVNEYRREGGLGQVNRSAKEGFHDSGSF